MHALNREGRGDWDDADVTAQGDATKENWGGKAAPTSEKKTKGDGARQGLWRRWLGHVRNAMHAGVAPFMVRGVVCGTDTRAMARGVCGIYAALATTTAGKRVQGGGRRLHIQGHDEVAKL